MNYTKIINLCLLSTDVLKPCPFCGGTNLALENTHTPCYWIECECGAEMHTRVDRSVPDRLYNRRAHHEKRKQLAIDAWNNRAFAA